MSPIPGVIFHGVVRTAANVDKSWIGTNARDTIGAELGGQQVTILNDADAAGLAETRYGPAKASLAIRFHSHFGPGSVRRCPGRR